MSYVAEIELTSPQKETISNAMIQYLEAGITITFEKCKTIKRSKSGKLKQFTSYVSV